MQGTKLQNTFLLTHIRVNITLKENTKYYKHAFICSQLAPIEDIYVQCWSLYMSAYNFLRMAQCEYDI